VFWPYLFGDILSSALWPYAYYDPFWAYGTSPVFSYGDYYGLNYGYPGPYDVYGSYGNGYSNGGRHIPRSAAAQTNINQIEAQAAQSCAGLAPDVAGLPIDRLQQAIRPTGDQVAALDAVADALSKARDIVDASCPSEPPLTPLGRLDAVEKRLDATVQAIEIVRPALASLYDSLSDEQRQRLDALGAGTGGNTVEPGRPGSSAVSTLASLCGRQAESFLKLPVQAIEEIIKPMGAQQSAFDQLKEESAKAAGDLRASCPAQAAQSPVARLDAMSDRLHAMEQAIEAVRPKLGAFYASLNDEQKARFNAMGQQNAGPPANLAAGRRPPAPRPPDE